MVENKPQSCIVCCFGSALYILVGVAIVGGGAYWLVRNIRNRFARVPVENSAATPELTNHHIYNPTETIKRLTSN